MLLIYPPAAKPCEPPAGIAHLAGALRGNGLPCVLLDANLEGMLFLLAAAEQPHDTWGRRAYRSLEANLSGLRNPSLYSNQDRYQRAVADVNRMLELVGLKKNITLSLANYQDAELSPLKSIDLIKAAEHPEENIFYGYFAERLQKLLAEERPGLLGFSLNYLSQAIPAFAMIGFVKQIAPALPVILGGGLVTSWLSNPTWVNPFGGFIDHLVPGPGEKWLIRLLGGQDNLQHHSPDFASLPLGDYLAPGFILPYAASFGCYWNKCSFCPEPAEKNPYTSTPTGRVLHDIDLLVQQTQPDLIHFLDNAVSPTLLKALASRPVHVNWYGFARIHPALTDAGYCRALRESGCVMLKLGLESGNQDVLDSMHKGIDLAMVADTLTALKGAGIGTYVYLLFGTPSESIIEARQTLNFIADHADAITFLNLAIFNMPVCSPEAGTLEVTSFSEGDLSLYTGFVHPRGWSRQTIRRFLDREFKRHPSVAPILRRDPPHFTSNHAPFFSGNF
ncbi:MAG: radical SAM protein [Desulfobulbaceae bacterium]|jgi:hypothetical protein|nr:radical SAM protein [Desulfobulbaceae bacterium]PLX47518.1 MAG: radical SAM protein [Desulfobulbaceae bacterium]